MKTGPDPLSYWSILHHSLVNHHPQFLVATNIYVDHLKYFQLMF